MSSWQHILWHAISDRPWLLADRADIDTIVVTDMSQDMLSFIRANVARTSTHAADADGNLVPVNAAGNPVSIHYVHADEARRGTRPTLNLLLLLLILLLLLLLSSTARLSEPSPRSVK